MSYHHGTSDEVDNDAGMLLNLSQKSSIFVVDQTPTPTRLIKNCEEVGLFDDLRNVNPFDETFRRACEQNIQHPGSNHNFHAEEEALHTPQVFPQFDVAVEGGISAGEDLSKHTLNTPGVHTLNTPVVLDNLLETPPIITKTNETDDISTSVNKYRPIAEKPAPSASSQSNEALTFMPSTVQFIQPQVITVTFPTAETNITTESGKVSKTNQKPLPIILPKLNTSAAKDSTSSSVVTSTTSSSSTPHPEPSSASLTPTSQLPIKERLKAILNQSSKSKPPEWPSNKCSGKSAIIHRATSSSSSSRKLSSKDDTMERRRAASTRYRQKMKKRNADLQMENEKLKQRVKQLEAQVAKLQTAALQPLQAPATITDLGIPAQIQIPASTIHLVMNIPKVVVPYGSNINNTQTILKNPITYRIDKN
ncbi:cyclic AMP-dependent transcription factor ATF-2 [Musca domestica]|uniref:Cyclic AMP-dependent transcription factor ATF-2 n=1 Tax=Musca domestica TaxID=7370 RepID=A0A1I8MWN3_MUSDO|nr:cyclic AMP-dependent transcription factor ATF-2 [Musca domestica]